MKRSQLILISSVLSVAMTLSACKKDNRTSARLAKAGSGSPSDPSVAGKGTQPDPAKRTTPEISKDASSAQIQCLKDLCKDTARSSIQEKIAKAQKISDAERTAIETRFNDVLDKKLEQEDALAKALLEQFAKVNLGQIKLNEKQERIVKFTLLSAENSEVDTVVKKDFEEELKNQDFYKAYQEFATKKGASYLLSLYKVESNASIVDAVKKEIEEIKKISEEIDGAIEAKRLMKLSEEVQSAIEGRPVSKTVVEAVSKAGYGARRFKHFILTEAGQKVLDKVTLKDNQIRELYEKSGMQDYLNAASETSKTAKESCVQKIHDVTALSPSKAEVETFKKLADQAKKAAKVLVAKDEALAAKIESFGYDKVLAQDEVESVVKERMTANAKALEKEIEKVKVKGYKPEALVTLAIVQQKLEYKDDVVCEKMVEKSLEEKMNLSDKSVQLSWYEVQNPSLGLSVLAREWGQLAASSSEFEKEQACLKERSGNESASEFANLFVAKLAAGNEGLNLDNLGCFYVSSENGPSLKSHGKNEIFESSLLAALQFATTKDGKAPSSCESLAKTENEKATAICK